MMDVSVCEREKVFFGFETWIHVAVRKSIDVIFEALEIWRFSRVSELWIDE